MKKSNFPDQETTNKENVNADEIREESMIDGDPAESAEEAQAEAAADSEESPEEVDEAPWKEKKQKLDIKGSFRTKNSRYGSYSSVLIAIVIVIAVVVNLIASQLPASLTSADLTSNHLYSIGSSTEEVLENLDEDVTIMVLSNKSSAEDSLKTLLDHYKSGSGHVKVEYVDPAVNVDASNAYSSLSEGSLVVQSGSREQTIDVNSIYTIDYTTYTQSFDGEGLITSAILYVTSEDLPKIYTVTGHGESTVSDTVSSLLSKQNVETADLNLMTTDGIPEDADALLIYAPTNDYSAEEAQTIIDYMNGGGKVLLLASYTGQDMTNFHSILEAYGISVEDGVVMETANHYYQYPMYILPTIDSSDITEDLLSSNLNLLIPNALGFSENGAEDVSVTSLLSSTSGAFIKKVTDGQIATMEQEDGDVTGPFRYAVLASRSTDSDEDGELIAISAASLIDDNVTQSFSLGNLDFFTACVSYLTAGDDTQLVSIDAKSMGAESITVSAMQSVIWGAVTVILIPAVVIIIGLIVWIRRKRK